MENTAAISYSEIEAKNTSINLSADFFLTETGEKAFYKRHIPLREIRTHYNKKGYGFHWSNFDAKLLQKLIINRHLKEIVIDRYEYTTKRKETEDITKLIIYGILFEEINREICQVFVNSEFIESLNTKNPLKRIDMHSRFDNQTLQEFLKNNHEAVNEFKNILSIDPIAVVDNDSDLDEKAKAKRKFIIRDIIDNIEAKNWFLFYFILRTEEKVNIMQEINHLILEYLQKIKIADYLSLMIIELLGNAEKGNFLTLLSTEGKIEKIRFAEMISNVESRQELLLSAEKHHFSIILSYKFSYHIKTDSYILTITVINKTTPVEEKAKKNSTPLYKHRTGKDLAGYLEDIPEEEISNTIGLFYLKFLNEVSKEVQMNFDAKVVFDDIRKETLSYLTLYF